jgi:hypothetical protein
VGEVAGHFVLEPEFLFLQAVEKVFVRVRPVLSLLEQSMKSGVLRLQFLGHGLVPLSASVVSKRKAVGSG